MSPRTPSSPPRPRLSRTQWTILRNVRDDGTTFYGRHGQPRGMSQHGGWGGAVKALVQRGLITYSHDANDLINGYALTESGTAFLAEWDA